MSHFYTPIMHAPHERGDIAIVDFGGQTAHLIASQIRRLGYRSRIVAVDAPINDIRRSAGIILSGGPNSVYDSESPTIDAALLRLGVPVLGICYGAQLIAHLEGGHVEPGTTKQYGHTPIQLETTYPLFEGLDKDNLVWMNHGDEVTSLPDAFENIARTLECMNAAFAHRTEHIMGVQFHPEVFHTPDGSKMLERFARLSNAEQWSMKNYIDDIRAEITEQVGDRNVFMLVSGGVDSTVAYTLLINILGPDRVKGLLIDTGMMRLREIDEIQAALAEAGCPPLEVEDASADFLGALEGVYEPEEKRTIIGNMFLTIQQRVAKRLDLGVDKGWMLGQGTIYPDTIESGGTKHAATIKTHHNRVGILAKMVEEGHVVEPLKYLYKNDVRELGEKELGLPHALIGRHPFPGPGLGVRILCATGPDAVEQLELGRPSVVLPVKSVGNQGDGRTYRHPIALFAQEPYTISPEDRRLATTVPNEHASINRVWMCLSRTEPVPLAVTPGTVTAERADLLRQADAIVTEEVQREDGLYDRIWQFPVSLIPVGTEGRTQSIVLRPIVSQDAMTAEAFMLPPSVIQRMTERLMELPDVDAVYYDLTSKPPATIELE